MEDSFLTTLVTIATAIIGVAILAVLVSQKSQTAQVIGAAGSAFAQDLGAALSPVTGGSNNLGSNLSNIFNSTGFGTGTFGLV